MTKLTSSSPVVEVPPHRSARSAVVWRNAVWFTFYLVCVLGGLFVARFALTRPSQPYLGVGFAALGLIVVLWVWFPATALGSTIFLALVGDLVTVSWFPFNKNLSSRESILYLADSISVSPLELTILAGLITTAYRTYASTGRLFRAAPLNRTLAVFSFFLFLGFARGISRGGDPMIALIEIRPLVYLPAIYLLTVAVCRSRTTYRRMYVAALSGIVIHSLLSLAYLKSLSEDVEAGLQSLVEHGAAISMNLLFVVFLASLVYRGIRPGVRLLLLVVCIPASWVYLVSERRAAIVSLFVALILLAVMLWWRQRRTFWKIVPIASVIAVGYLGAFWSVESTAGFPAQAVKSVVAPGQLGVENQSSDIYREIEKWDISVTIRSEPVLGVGFGNAFLQPVTLPPIAFGLQAYIPHNSLLWIWIKVGLFGFVSFLYLVARSIVIGIDRARRVLDPVDALLAVSAVLFVVMFTVFLYVEIAWEPRNVVLLSLSMALCTGPLDGGSRGTEGDDIEQGRREAEVRSGARKVGAGALGGSG